MILVRIEQLTTPNVKHYEIAQIILWGYSISKLNRTNHDGAGVPQIKLVRDVPDGDDRGRVKRGLRGHYPPKPPTTPPEFWMSMEEIFIEFVKV